MSIKPDIKIKWNYGDVDYSIESKEYEIRILTNRYLWSKNQDGIFVY
jgi:hypothetical protein